MQKLQKTLSGAVILSELSHIFCCGLPVLFSLASLLAGIGFLTVVPGWLEHLHHALHDYEIPLIMASGVILVSGWGLHYIAKRLDCRSTGCAHEPCGPKKKRSDRILLAATVLYCTNVVLYTFLHYPHI